MSAPTVLSLSESMFVMTNSFNRPDEESAFRATRLTYRTNAETRGLVFALTDSELRALFSSDCHYCGGAPSNVTKKARVGGQAVFKYNGVDRENNTIGYILGNCVACCKTRNWMKQRMSPQEFIDHCRRVADRAVQTTKCQPQSP